ncbi:hypothetical protein Sste5346_004678 [Sporothrix stenoceras]|uniref:Uncharacterized protein n=1 Tax=Sporothrix stenoceras TaxID=5173 RepID=A0ABR3Z890_9PEZI
MNTNGVFSKLHDFDLDVPPDLDLNDIGPMLSKLGSTSSPTSSPTSTSTSKKEVDFPWNMGLANMDLNAMATSDHFALLHSTATKLYADHAGTLQSLGASIQPHLRGPMTPVLIIAVSIMVSLLVSFIVSIIQMAVLACVVVYFFPSVVAAVSAGAAGAPTGRPGAAAGKSKPVASRTPVAAFAGVLAASYAFSSIATMVVLASSAYAYLNHYAVAAKNSAANNNNSSSNSNNSFLRPDARSTRRDERSQSHSSMFRRISRHRDSY